MNYKSLLNTVLVVSVSSLVQANTDLLIKNHTQPDQQIDVQVSAGTDSTDVVIPSHAFYNYGLLRKPGSASQGLVNITYFKRGVPVERRYFHLPQELDRCDLAAIEINDGSGLVDVIANGITYQVMTHTEDV